MRRHAQPPGARAKQKAHAGESEDRQETPADLADAVDDLGRRRRGGRRSRTAPGHPAPPERSARGHAAVVMCIAGRQLGRRASICLKVSSIRRSLSSFDTLRWSSFEAIAIEMSTASLRICCKRARGLHLDLPLGVLDDAGGLGLRLLLQLVAEPAGVRPRLREDRRRPARAPRRGSSATRRADAPAPASPAAHRRATCGSCPAAARAPPAAAARRTSPAATAGRETSRWSRCRARDRAGPAGYS